MDPVAPTPTSTAAGATEAPLFDAVRAALAEAYEHPLLVARPDGTIAVLAGRALERARDAAEQFGGHEAVDRIVELEIGDDWFAVPATGLQLWRQQGRSGSGGELVTDLVLGDPPVRIVVDVDGWRLVRLADGAQGWLDPSQPGLLAVLAAPVLDSVGDTKHVDVDAFVARIIELLGVPYVWGGTSPDGVDCSGIVQRAAWDASGRLCWLPRHSRALLRVGTRVSPSKVTPGDVLVLQRDPSTYEAEQRAQLDALAAEEARTGSVPAHGPAIHPMHVAVAVSADEVIHASRDAMRVVREPIASLRERYRVLGVRRLGGAQ